MMKKVLTLLPMVAVLAACSSTDPYQKRADEVRERQEKYVERSIDKAPKWMTELPTSNNAVYSNGTGVSGNWNAAVIFAKSSAYESICMAAGGEVDSRTKTYTQDSATTTSIANETATVSKCRNVDITGVEEKDRKIVQEGNRYRVYVLLALPTGEANAIQTRKDRITSEKNAVVNSEKLFREIEKDRKN
jgi:hypothetical protein